MKFRDLVPPLELCKQIPVGEFEDSAFCWVDKGYACVLPDAVIPPERHPFVELRRYTIQGDEIPAPTLQEILEELHKLQEDVFLKWSETAYNEWLVNAYTHNVNDYQAHDKNPATAALKIWFELKGIENEHSKDET